MCLDACCAFHCGRTETQWACGVFFVPPTHEGVLSARLFFRSYILSHGNIARFHILSLCNVIVCVCVCASIPTTEQGTQLNPQHERQAAEQAPREFEGKEVWPLVRQG